MNDRTKGLSIILFGVLCVSPDAVLVRFLTTHGSNPWTIIFWKLFLSIPLSAGYAIYEAGGLKKLVNSIARARWYYVAVVPVQGVIDIGFTLSFVYTSAANALLLINLNPLWCAIVGRLFLNDVLPKRTIFALVLALGCMMIIFIPEMVLDEDDEQDGEETSWRGNIISLSTGFLLAMYLSIIRKAGREDKSLIAGTALGASLSTVISAGVARGQVLPGQFWEVELWKFWLAVIAQGLGIGIIFITMVSVVFKSVFSY
ncbi:hypothetical protein HJC23_013453 [Cyclotella cryptica]|uniref:EamA domain-containing protein n=1 Tax=Cyclotella cryptica TaxID=29204 RepID=A0ABD3P083_9STRA